MDKCYALHSFQKILHRNHFILFYGLTVVTQWSYDLCNDYVKANIPILLQLINIIHNIIIENNFYILK